MVATYMEYHEMLVGLTHTCTQWRRIITTYPTLWTDVRFDREDVSLASLCFERAKGCAVDVRFSFRALRRRPRSYMKESILPTFFPGNRVRSLFINRSWSTFQELVERCGDALSTLQVLEIDAGNLSITSLHNLSWRRIEGPEVGWGCDSGLVHYQSSQSYIAQAQRNLRNPVLCDGDP